MSEKRCVLCNSKENVVEVTSGDFVCVECLEALNDDDCCSEGELDW